MKATWTDRALELVTNVRPERLSDETLEKLCVLIVWLVARSRRRAV